MRGGDNGPVSGLYVSIGAALRRTRTAKRLALADVETQSEGRFGASALAAYERGSRRVHVETLFALAEFYDVSVEAFLPVPGTGSVLVSLDDVLSQIESLRGVGA